jgi:hypothetical protein
VGMVGRERITYATLTSVIDLSFSDAAAGSARVSDAVAATAAADATAIAKRCSALQHRMVNCMRVLVRDDIHTHALTYFVAIEVRVVTSKIKIEL